MENKYQNSSQSGFSIVELIIVLAVMAIVVGFALIYTDRSRAHLQRQNVANKFKNYLERARFDSVKRRVNPGEESRVRINNATSFSVVMDFNQDGNLDAATETVTDNSLRNFGSINVGSLNFPVNIQFDRLGKVTVVHGSSNAVSTAAPSFTFCSQNCTTSSQQINNEYKSVVSISSTGTVALLAGGNSNPTPQSTNVNSIQSNTGINSYTHVGTANTY